MAHGCYYAWENTFAHELGHLFGARHNSQQDSTNTPWAYQHGWLETCPAFSGSVTVHNSLMAYPASCGSAYVSNVQYNPFSGAVITFNWCWFGVCTPLALEPVGNRASNTDNAQVHRNNGIAISNIAAECFPGSAEVLVPGGRMRMSQLRVGDLIGTGVRDGSFVYEPIYAFADHVSEEATSYSTITHAGGELSLTPYHLLFVVEGGSMIAKYAKEVLAGDVISIIYDTTWSTATVSDVKHGTWKRGAYAPLVPSGVLIVDDVLASCYARVPHAWGHLAFAPLRVAASLGLLTTEPQEGVHPYARFLLTIFPNAGELISEGKVRSDSTAVRLIASLSKGLNI